MKLRCRRWLMLAAVLTLVLVPFGTTWLPPAAAGSAVVRWGYYVTYDSTSQRSLESHIGQLDIVAPYFYHLKADGTIEDFSDPEALRLMRRAGVKIVPMIKNLPRWDDFHATIETVEKRDAIVDRLVQLVMDHQYDGIHIDFEALNASDRELLTDFMQHLSTQLHARGKLVTQAVISRRSPQQVTTWNGVYDYAELAKVNDYIVVMAYDHHSVGSGPGPIAPIPWVQDVVDYAKTQIPKAKLLLGMPLYGYDWDLDSDEYAASVRHDQAMKLLDRVGVESGYDVTQHEPWIQYTADNGHRHEVWYQNADSLRAKLKVMQDEDVGGFALWRLGQEDPAVWDEISRLNTPATRTPAFPDSTDRVYFSETGHSLAYGFKSFWERSGGLAVFGYPLTEEFDEANPDTLRVYTVQYFERQRFEYHPEHRLTPYEVQLGRLGVTDAQARGLLDSQPFKPLPSEPSREECDFFPETGHSLCTGFRSYWRSHGLEFGDSGVSPRESLALFGYPISEEFTDPATGLTIQYFERARFEYHPEHAGTEYEVQLGLLGTDTIRAKGWIR